MSKSKIKENIVSFTGSR
uniref:Uncharacterized protein n=1 Tax=Knipowitschia caucasica TaxID=637954 RepID=A0AAV2KTS3_KNICA